MVQEIHLNLPLMLVEQVSCQGYQYAETCGKNYRIMGSWNGLGGKGP